MIYKWYIRVLTRFTQSDDVLVRSCFSLINNNANSILGNTFAYFRDRFEININPYTLNDNSKKMKCSNPFSDDERIIINIIRSLLLI